MRYVWSGIIFPSEVAGYNWNPLIAPYSWRTFFFILLHIEMKSEEAKEAWLLEINIPPKSLSLRYTST